MSLLFLTFVTLILRGYCLNSFGIFDEIEFPPSWHFFENHNSLESYKYGFFLQTLLQIKKKSEKNGELFSNIISYNIETMTCEMDEDVSNLLNNPIILVDNKISLLKEKNTKNVLFCQERASISSIKEKLKVRIRTLEVKQENGNILRLMLNFSKVGLWIWESSALMKNNFYNKSNCFLVGTKDKIRILQKSLHSKIKVSELQIEIPFFNSMVVSKSMHKFITENKIDGIIGLNDNTIQGVGVFETTSRLLDSSEGRYIISFECSRLGGYNQINQNKDSLIFAIYNGNNKKYLKNEKNISIRENDSTIELLLDNEVKSKFNIKLSLNLNIHGAIIPEYRSLQLFSIINKYAIQKGYKCGTRQTYIGRNIFCDCNFLNSNLIFKIHDKENSYSINLSNFVINNGKNQESCLIEIYGKRTIGVHVEESWIFGQVLCNASNINNFYKMNNSNWKIGSPKFQKR